MGRNNQYPVDHIWCAIPVYNNKDTLKAVSLACRSRIPHVVVVDDGSTDTDVAELLSGTDIEVLRHERNLGKGCAILTALRFVEGRGGRFMITIDGDGQHFPHDLDKFIPLLQNDDAVLVIGCRNFSGENIPGSSRFGRRFANFWLRFEAGVSIDDCQSGFRAYPVRYLSKMALNGSYYDFEAEVLAKAAWAGLQLKTIDIDVWYPDPEQRISSFRPFRDNFRISCMHTRLVARRLLPLPHKKLVGQADQERRIEAKKRGNRLGFWFFKTALRLTGLRGAYGLLYFVCLYYTLFDRAAVSTAMSYVKRRFSGSSYLNKLLRIYLLFVSQGKQLIDRYALRSGYREFDIQLKGYEQFMALVQGSPKGLILLTAHVGNWQVTMEALGKIGRTVHLLMRPEDNPAVEDSLLLGSGREFIKVISPEQYLGGTIEVMGALEQGHIVSIMGDRSYDFNSTDVSFLGDKAWFPYGAFLIAASVGCPVVVLLSAKISANQYVVDVSNEIYPHYEGRHNKAQQLKKWVQEFAAILDRYVEQYPYQCFLFHDVWHDESKGGLP